MTLTKARPPVTDIDTLENGTTIATIPVADGAIDIDVAGTNAVDITSSLFTVDDAVTLVANTMTGEDISLSTAAGASGQAITNATDMKVGTTSLHPIEILMNSVAALTVTTAGRVALNTVGTANNELVDKEYVDTAVSGAATLPSISTSGTEGSLTIPTTGNDFVINWGQITGLPIQGTGSTTFHTPYTSGTVYSIVFTIINTGQGFKANGDQISNTSLTGFDVVHSGGEGSLNDDGYWIAIGSRP